MGSFAEYKLKEIQMMDIMKKQCHKYTSNHATFQHGDDQLPVKYNGIIHTEENLV